MFTNKTAYCPQWTITPSLTRRSYSRAGSLGYELGWKPSVHKLSNRFRLLVYERLVRNPDYPVRVYEHTPSGISAIYQYFVVITSGRLGVSVNTAPAAARLLRPPEQCCRGSKTDPSTAPAKRSIEDVIHTRMWSVHAIYIFVRFMFLKKFSKSQTK